MKRNRIGTKKRGWRVTAALLSVILLLGIAASPVSADTAENVTVAFERVTGAMVSGFVRLFNLVTFKDEARIKKAAARDAAGDAFDGTLFTGNPEQTLDAETWRVVEVTYESEKTYADPFADVTLDLRLAGNGRVYTVPGFWDGGSTWRVRFVCPAAGVYQFITVCSDADNAALHGRTGEVNCAAYAGDLAVYKHGFVTTRYGEKFLTYEDGTPFYYLGDTHWQLAQESADMVDTICAKRVEQGFTVYESQPMDCKFNNDITDHLTDESLPSLRAVEENFRVIASHGLTHANSQFFWPLAGMHNLIERHGGWTEPVIKGRLGTKRVTMPDLSDEAKAYLEKVCRYWVARFSAYPVIWTLGQEVDNDPYQNETSKWNAVNNPYKYVATYLNKYDPYDHPVTAHQESTGDTVAYGNGLGTGEVRIPYYPNGAPSAFRDVEAHTMYAAQWHPSLIKRDDYVSAKDYWYNGQGKPVVNYEGLYCYLWTKNFGARAQAWASYLSGLYGCAWGGQPTWAYQNGFERDIPSDDGVDTIRPEEKQAAIWQDALEYPSTYQMGYMRQFMEAHRWNELIPRFNNYAHFVPSKGVFYDCASTKENDVVVFYFYSFSDPSVAERPNATGRAGYATGTVGCLTPGATYVGQWFDPISGTYGRKTIFTASGLGTYYIGDRPTCTDMVYVIEKA